MISSIVLAAGKSTRMGQQKMLMPWGQTTVIGQVVSILIEAGVSDIHLVVGGNQAELMDALEAYPISYTFNKDFANGEMLNSVQVGLKSLGNESDAAMIVLGDQPQIETRVVQTILNQFVPGQHKIYVPSFKMHRGHPWMVEKLYWPEILRLNPPSTMRDFINAHEDTIEYIPVDTPSIIQDLDTQSDYLKYSH